LSGALSDRSCHPRGCQVVPSDRIRHPRTLGVVRGSVSNRSCTLFLPSNAPLGSCQGVGGKLSGVLSDRSCHRQLPWDPLSLPPSRGVAPIGRPRAVRRLARASRKAVPEVVMDNFPGRGEVGSFLLPTRLRAIRKFSGIIFFWDRRAPT